MTTAVRGATNIAQCPKCAGTARMPYEGDPWWRDITSGYDKGTGTVPCDNCGGQTMSSRGIGVTTVDPATGLGCLHGPYTYLKLGNCYHGYTCPKCGFFFDIDSGD